MNDANNHATRVGEPRVRTDDGLQPPSGAARVGIAIRGVGASLALLAGVVLLGCGGPKPAALNNGGSPTVRASAIPGAAASPGAERTPATTETRVATATPTAEAPAPSITQPTAARTVPTPTATAALPPPGAPLRSIAVGEWAFDYRLVGNSCGTTPDATSLAVTQKIEEVSGNDGYISDGEQVRVYGFNGGPSIGLLTFRWPALSFQVPLNEPDGIRVEVTHTFADARTGTSRVVEVYRRGTATCELTYSG